MSHIGCLTWNKCWFTWLLGNYFSCCLWQTAVCAAGRRVLTVVARVFQGGLNLELVCETQRLSDPKISSSSLHCCISSSIKLSEFESVVYVALFVYSLLVRSLIFLFLFYVNNTNLLTFKLSCKSINSQFTWLLGKGDKALLYFFPFCQEFTRRYFFINSLDFWDCF